MTITDERRRELFRQQAIEREYDKMAKTHTCAECGNPLVVPHDPTVGHRILVCGTNRSHKGFARQRSWTELWRAGLPVPMHIAQKLENKYGRRPMDTKALTTMSEAQMLARIEQARFPQDLTTPQKRLLALVSIDYGLDPALGELLIYEGRPYISIDGRRRKAQETDQLDGISTRPATQDERQAWDIPDADYFFFAEVRRRGSAYPFVGYGRVRAAETKRSEKEKYAEARGGKIRPIVVDPQGMAAKRAEARALRMAFSLPLPSAEYAGTPEDEAPYIEGEARELPIEEPEAEPAAAPQVDRETGEVTEPETPTEVTRSEEAGTDAGPQLPPPDLPMKSLGDLFNACNKYFGLKKPDVYRILTIRDATEISDLKDAWATVLAHKLPPEVNE